MKSIKVGLLGVGNVGSGTFNVLQRNQEEIAAAPAVASKWWPYRPQSGARQGAHRRQGQGGGRPVRHRQSGNRYRRRTDRRLRSGQALVLQAIANGKHVVTANKALLAVHGNEILQRPRPRA
jgi:homoserine dehydrogenase